VDAEVMLALGAGGHVGRAFACDDVVEVVHQFSLPWGVIARIGRELALSDRA
jgi:hypothetical protein